LCVDWSRGDIYVTQTNYYWHKEAAGNSDSTITKIETGLPINLMIRQASGANGDPHFLGFHGDTFDVKGAPDQVYNLLSHKMFAVNVKFVAGTTQRLVEGELVPEAGTFMSEAGVVIDDEQNTKHIRVLIEKVENAAGKTEAVVRVMYNGVAVTEKDKKVGQVQIQLKRKTAFISTPTWDVAFNAHMSPLGQPMINLRYIKAKVDPLSMQVAPHGLLGQTWDADEIAVNGAKGAEAQGEGAIEGTIDDYKVSGLFAVDFAYNRFHVIKAAARNIDALSGEKLPASKNVEGTAGAEN
jgi:hypothetical protein